VKKIDTKSLVSEETLRSAAEAYLSAGERGLTRKSMATKLGMSMRTEKRARDLLAEQGARFESRRDGQRREVRFVMKKGPKWDSQISSEANLALKLAGEAISHGGGHLFKEQLDVIEQLADQAMTSRDRSIFRNLKEKVRVIGGFDDDPTTEQAEVLRDILLAFSTDIAQELEIDYLRPLHSRSWRLQMAPHCLTQDVFSGGCYLLGWDIGKRQPVQLRTSRILAVRPTGRPAIIPDEALLKRVAHLQMGGWISTEPEFEVKVRIKGDSWIQSMRESQPDFPGFSLQMESRCSALVRFMANHLVGPQRWVLQMGAAAEVLEPEALRLEIRKTAQAILEQ